MQAILAARDDHATRTQVPSIFPAELIQIMRRVTNDDGNSPHEAQCST